jgi:hypothetical protein
MKRLGISCIRQALPSFYNFAPVFCLLLFQAFPSCPLAVLSSSYLWD